MLLFGRFHLILAPNMHNNYLILENLVELAVRFLRCDFMNFAKNNVCLQCDAKRPKRQLLPGEWECPQYALPPLTFIN